MFLYLVVSRTETITSFSTKNTLNPTKSVILGGIGQFPTARYLKVKLIVQLPNKK